MESACLPIKTQLPGAYSSTNEVNPKQKALTGDSASVGFDVWSKETHPFCTECEDTRASLICVECDEEYCMLCWAALHRRGARSKHDTIPLESGENFTPPPEVHEDSGWLAGVWPSIRDTLKTPPDKDAGVAINGNGSVVAANVAEAAATNGSTHMVEDNGTGCAHATADANSDVGSNQSQDRPDGYEGPLCFSGNFFSKCQENPIQKGKRGREEDDMVSFAVDKRWKCSVSSSSGSKRGEKTEGAGASESPTSFHSTAPGLACGETKRSSKTKVEVTSLDSGVRESNESLPMECEPNGVDCVASSSSAFPGVIPKEADVEPMRTPTKEEADKLTNLKTRSTHILLRLDEREREILRVLKGSLHHVQYTDAVDRLLPRGSKVPCALKNLKAFFTSLWGMFKALDVTPTRYSLKPPPKHTNGVINGSNNTTANNGSSPSGSQGFIGPRSPPPSPSQSFSFRGVSVKKPAEGVCGQLKSSVTNGAMACAGVPVKQKMKERGAAGAATYKEDSFTFRLTDVGYTADWASVIRTCFEVGRRYKILNPEKMRSSHGMLMYMIMDSRHPQVWRQTGFTCLRTLRTVFGLAASTNLLGIFEDPDLLIASRPVLPWEYVDFGGHEKGKKDSTQLADEAKEKAAALKRLVVRHGKEGMSCEVSLLVNSLADSIVYREISTRPIRRMIALLKLNWRPNNMDEDRSNVSLAIVAGQYGSRLSHSHRMQYYFVLQSLFLWLEVLDNMLDLWAAAEEDMFDMKNHYRLMNTGQGLQRVQGASRVGEIMRDLQRRVVSRTSQQWVGSPVVHLGDNCVPNALTFLDKYSQVPYILNPILRVVDYFDELQGGKDPPVLKHVETRWPSVDFAKRHMLRNFFKCGFDGSGANNNYDAGSCIDGRLTSAWNWCSKLEKKSFYHLFMCSGFTGFDGDFSQ